MYLQHVSFYEHFKIRKGKRRNIILRLFAAISKCNSVHIKMARPCFPGRPGQRIGKNYVKYVFDDMNLSTKSCTPGPCNIQMGLKIFYELFGFSDEEEEFDGFTTEDILKAESILAIKIKNKKKIDDYVQSRCNRDPNASSSSDFDKFLTTGTSDSETSSSTRRRQGMRNIMRKKYDKMIKEGFCQNFRNSSIFVTKSNKTNALSLKAKDNGYLKNRILNPKLCSDTHLQMKADFSQSKLKQEEMTSSSFSTNKTKKKIFIGKRLLSAVEQKRPRGRPRLKKVRIVKRKFPKRFKYSSRLKYKPLVSNPNAHSTKSYRNKIHSLLKPSLLFTGQDSTFDGCINTSQLSSKIPKEQSLTFQKRPIGRPRKFVLPTISARSCRKIIPRKRYLEDSSKNIGDDVKKLLDEESQSSRSSLSVSSETISAMDGGSSPEVTEFEDEKPVKCDLPKKIGLLDQPLVVECKRPWKPSLKVQMKLSETNYGYPFSLKKNADDSSGTGNSSGSFKDIIKPDMVSKYAEKMAQKPKEKVPKIAECAKKHVPPVCNKKDLPVVESNTTDAEGDSRKPVNKLEKVAAKIEKLLKSQWEDRLKDTTVMMSKLESSVAQWKSEAQQRSCNQRRTKNILRKARLQLKKRNLNLRTQKADSVSNQMPCLDNKSLTPVVVLERTPKALSVVVNQVDVPSKAIKSSNNQQGTCVICGFSKLYFHAEKLYEQMSCEPCTRFFESFADSPKQYFCVKEGNCFVDISSEVTTRRVSNARCKACWLKACMQKLAVSTSLRDQLIKYVPRLDAPPHNPLLKDTTALLEEPRMLNNLTGNAEKSKNVETNAQDSHTMISSPPSNNNATPDNYEPSLKTDVEGQQQNAGNIRKSLRLSCQQQNSAEIACSLPVLNLDIAVQPPSTSKSQVGKASKNENKPPVAKKLAVRKMQSAEITESVRQSKRLSKSLTTSVGKVKRFPSKAITTALSSDVVEMAESSVIVEQEVDRLTVIRQEAPHRGPRIKHVCRRAAVVLGLPVATFSDSKAKEPFHLSALPLKEKQKLLDSVSVPVEVPKPKSPAKLKKQPIKKKVHNKNMKAKNRIHLNIMKKSSMLSHKKEKKRKLLVKKSVKHLRKHSIKKSLKVGHKGERRKTLKYSLEKEVKTLPVKEISKSVTKLPAVKYRKVRCRQCKGCLADDCGKCSHCKDKKKFGGPNLIKQACMYRRCLQPNPSTNERRISTLPENPKTNNPPIFDGPSGLGTTLTSSSPSSPDASSCASSCSSSSSSSSSGSSGSSSSSSNSSTGSSSSSSSSSSSVNNSAPNGNELEDNCGNVLPMQNIATEPVLRESVCDEDNILYEESSTVIELKNASFTPSLMYAMGDYGNGDSLSWSSSAQNQGSGQSTSEWRGNKREGDQYNSHGSGSPDSDDPDDEDGGNNNESSFKKKKYFIRADYWDDYDYERATSQGVALITSQQINFPELCYLCGSAGEEKLIFCSLCCEPFHTFCLLEEDVPTGENVDNWYCRRCQSCSVCGLKNNLVKCKKCQNTYHSECLPPQFPTKPSRKKKIWMCPKCVKCKSCGTNSPASAAGPLWNFDLLLCQCCAKLTDKGILLL